MERIAKDSPLDCDRLSALGSQAFHGASSWSNFGRPGRFSHIRTCMLSLNRREVDLKAAVMECLRGTAKETRRSGTSISVMADQAVIGRWDPVRIHQIISNLLSNAIKYGEGKPVEITIGVDKNTERANSHPRSRNGYPHELQSKIFARFERAPDVTNIQGLGLGLYIVQQIIQAHDGTIRVESERGKGVLLLSNSPSRKMMGLSFAKHGRAFLLKGLYPGKLSQCLLNQLLDLYCVGYLRALPEAQPSMAAQTPAQTPKCTATNDYVFRPRSEND